MPTKIPNFLTNAQTPLGQAFSNLSSVLMSEPGDAEKAMGAAQYQALQQKSRDDASKGAALTDLGTRLSNPDLYKGNMAGTPSVTDAKDPALSTVGVTPIAQAFAPQPVDWGGLASSAVRAGVNPNDLGGYVRFEDANALGTRDPKTENAQVGAGQGYNTTAESFDINQANDMQKAANTNATSAANNKANINKDIQLEGMKENHDDVSGATELDPATVKYLADQVRNGAPLPALGMGKQAAAMRSAILKQAAADDTAAGRSGTDAVLAKTDYAGNVAGSRTLANREANAGMAVNELSNLIPTAKAAFHEVFRTGVYPVDAVINAAQHGTNDPALAKLAVSVNDAVNAHARAINPQGVVTDAGRAQGFGLLSQVQDEKAADAALDQMQYGAQQALKSPGQTRAQMHDQQRSTLGGAPAPAQASAPETWVRGPDGKLQRAQ